MPLRTRIQKSSRVTSPRNGVQDPKNNKVSLVCSTNQESLQQQTKTHTDDEHIYDSNYNGEHEHKTGGVRVRHATRDSN